jgi:dTMP kinase
LIDRFVDSTIAYQHYGMGVDVKMIKTINQFLLKEIKVNFTFLNLVSKKNMILRLSKRKKLNRYDKFKSNFYTKVQNGFIKIAKKNPKIYMNINSNLEVNFNKKLIISKLNQLI